MEKKSRIIGGNVFAVRGIEALVLGSPGEVATSIRVGVREEVLASDQRIREKGGDASGEYYKDRSRTCKF